MMKITNRGWEDTDLGELATLTFNALQDSPSFRAERTLTDVEEWLNWNYEHFTPASVFLAHIRKELAGWLAVTLDIKPGISEIWRWLPYISPKARKDEIGIATGLIRRCVEYVEGQGQTRLEACFDRISEATMPEYERYRSWFEAGGFNRVDETAYMSRSLKPEEFSENEIVLPDGYDYIPLVDVNEEALYDCYSRAFIESGVRVYHDMTEEERHNDFEHYFKARNRNEKASMVVVRDGEILGFSLVHSRPREAHLADIGIVPAHRGKGLGRKIMKHSLMKAAMDYDTMTLAVDVDNTSAYELFGDFGFEVDYRIITHAWKKVFKLGNN